MLIFWSYDHQSRVSQELEAYFGSEESIAVRPHRLNGPMASGDMGLCERVQSGRSAFQMIQTHATLEDVCRTKSSTFPSKQRYVTRRVVESQSSILGRQIPKFTCTALTKHNDEYKSTNMISIPDIFLVNVGRIPEWCEFMAWPFQSLRLPRYTTQTGTKRLILVRTIKA